MTLRESSRINNNMFDTYNPELEMVLAPVLEYLQRMVNKEMYLNPYKPELKVVLLNDELLMDFYKQYNQENEYINNLLKEKLIDKLSYIGWKEVVVSSNFRNSHFTIAFTRSIRPVSI